MASIPSSPSSTSFESTQVSPSSPLAQQQQQGGDDGDVVILRAIEKLHVASVALGPEDDNQDDDEEDKAGKEDVDGVDSSAPGQQEYPASTGSEQSEQFQQRQQQPQEPSLDKLKIDRLTQEKHALEKQMKDVSTQFTRQLHALQTQLHQQTAAHDRKEQEWKQQEKQLQKTRNDAVDDARRVQAQVQLLEQRVRELEELVPSENNDNDSLPQQALTPSAEPTLHLTQRQSYSLQRQYHHQPPGNSSGTSHPHAVQRSVVGSTTIPNSGSNVTCHPQNPRSDCSSTVRITRIGRNRSVSSEAASADTRDSSQTQAQASSTTIGSSSSSNMMPPPTLNPFQWREVASIYERQGITATTTTTTTTTGYRGYSSPLQQRSSTLPAPMSVRPDTFYPTQSYINNSYPQQQHRSPIEYSQQFVASPPAMGSASPAGLAPESTTLISICPIPDEASTPGSTEPQDYDFRLEKKPSSGFLAYCSELLTSSLAPAASVAIAPSATGTNNTNTVSPNAKVAPTWQLFNSSNNSQLGKQMSLDVEQGFSPPRPHQIPLEMQQHQIQQQQQRQSYFTTSSSSCNNYNSASAPQLQPSYQGSPISSPPPQHGRASSVLPTHSFSPF